MVRAMNSNERDFDIFFKNNVVAIGWSDVDFSKFNQDQVAELRSEVYSSYYKSEDVHPATIGKKLNEIERFHTIKAGDIIIVPYYNSIRLSKATDQAKYSIKDKGSDLSNQRTVEYDRSLSGLKTIPRNSLSEGLQRRLRVRGSTVSNLYEFKDEIEHLFNFEDYSWIRRYEDKQNAALEETKNKLKFNLTNGNTNLQTGGIGLEHLAKELFEHEGYTAQVLSKKSFDGKGDADILAVKSDRFNERKLLIQVKHHSGFTLSWGFEQLNLIQESGLYDDHEYILLTSADVDQQLRDRVEKRNIQIVDGEELVEWILDQIDLLSEETKMRLGLSTNPRII